MSRLETASKSLVDALRQASEERQQAACLAACEFAVGHSGVNSPVINQGLQLLQASQSVPAELKQDLVALAQRLDDEYFVLQESAEDGNVSQEKVQRAFSQARAVSALIFAFGENAFESASEAIYEAVAAVDENKELLAIVLKACG